MKKILIIDDESSIRLSFFHLFSMKGNTVITCRSKKEAKDALARDVFDLIITDVRLDSRDGTEGIELLSLIKSRGITTPVIIITGYGSPEIEKECHERGAVHYFEKPVKIQMLIDKVRELGIQI